MKEKEKGDKRMCISRKFYEFSKNFLNFFFKKSSSYSLILIGAFCDASFPHGDILDHAAKSNHPSDLFSEIPARLHTRDVIAQDVRAMGDAAEWDGAWNVRVLLPHAHQALLKVDPNYGDPSAQVFVEAWTAVGEDGSGAAQRALARAHERGLTLPEVAQILASACA